MSLCCSNVYGVYTYGSSLETESTRFSQPGSFFTYLIFVGAVILVSIGRCPHSDPTSQPATSYSCLYLSFSLYTLSVIQAPRIICPPSHHLAEAVPGDEVEHPRISHDPSFAINPKRIVCGAGMVGTSFEKACVTTESAFGGFGSLHISHLFSFSYPRSCWSCLNIHEALDSRTVLTGNSDNSRRLPRRLRLHIRYGTHSSSLFLTLLAPPSSLPKPSKLTIGDSTALTLALAYTYSQDNRNRKVTIFIITIPVPYLPYAMLLMTFVMGGPNMALQQATGLVAAHLYDFLTRIYPTFGGGRNFIQTPAVVQRWFGASSRSETARGYGTAFRPATQQGSQGRSTGFGGGISGIWGGRGAGRRLGGD